MLECSQKMESVKFWYSNLKIFLVLQAVFKIVNFLVSLQLYIGVSCRFSYVV